MTSTTVVLLPRGIPLRDRSVDCCMDQQDSWAGVALGGRIADGCYSSCQWLRDFWMRQTEGFHAVWKWAR
ncbi:hypothetical protein GCM10028775_13950 [Catellatospora paridis]